MMRIDSMIVLSWVVPVVLQIILPLEIPRHLLPSSLRRFAGRFLPFSPRSSLPLF